MKTSSKVPEHIEIETEFGIKNKSNSRLPKGYISGAFGDNSSSASNKGDNVCRICSKTFSTTSNMLRHVRTHLGRRFVCHYENCDSLFTQRSSLQFHIGSVHAGIIL